MLQSTSRIRGITNMQLLKANLRQSFFARLSVLLLCAICCLANSNPARAHTLDQSYIFLNLTETGLNGRLELPIDTLQIGIRETVPDFVLDEAHVSDSQWQIIEAYIRNHLHISQEEGEYQLEFLEREALEIEVAKYIVVQFIAEAPGPIPDKIFFSFSAITHAVDSHRIGLVMESNYLTGLEGNHREFSNFFAPGRETFTLNTRGDSWFNVLYRFVVEGVIHIWIGIDHVLFIITLLFMSVVARAGRHYESVGSLWPAVLNMLTLITIFTVAHTITLFLGLKGWVDLPASIVEPIIALSIVVVALNNIFPVAKSKIVVGIIIFVFGLFHGLGFASVLLELALGPNAKLLSLLGFNIGVELGQIIIVLCVFPVLYLLRNRDWYNPVILQTCSAGVALIGSWWFVTRVFEPGL